MQETANETTCPTCGEAIETGKYCSKECYYGRTTVRRVDEHGRTCHWCDQYLTWDSFGKKKRGTNGKATICRSCRPISNHRLTVNAYEELLAAQDGRCVCGAEFGGTPNIDHDHACCDKQRSCGDCIRGLLCEGCNKLLGFASDNPERLETLAGYLRRVISV